MKHPVVVMMIETKLKTSVGDISLVSKEWGSLGMMPVYDSKKAARKVWGRKVMLARVEMSPPAPEEEG